MACARDTNIQITDEEGEYILYKTIKQSNCRKYKPFYPSFAPTINSLSVTSSVARVYSLVYINGSNFLPPCYGTTYVNFGSFKKIPIVFYSTSTISFIIPLNAVPGYYNVQVVNIYNGNFSPAVNQSYAGNPNFSNSFTYRLYKISYSLTGTHSITSDSNYNTIITFTSNGTFTILNQYSSIPINYTVVGGGGGGGGGNIGGAGGGGGGGGGGVSTGSFNTSITNYNIIVGGGGQGGNFQTTTPSTDGANGSSTQISGVITVNEGLGGKASSNRGTGGDSGNGGTGGTGNISPAGGTGVNGGGGGGGKYNSPGGKGSVSTTSVYSYGTSFGAGGGGGGGNNQRGTAGNSYAGNGGSPDGQSATDNYGGGGGGGESGNGISGTNGNGGNGGSGVVILYFNI
jgi:hypothetical protein